MRLRVTLQIEELESILWEVGGRWEGRGKREGGRKLRTKSYNKKDRETESSVECLNFHRQTQLFFYKKMAGRKASLAPMPLTDHVFSGCTQRDSIPKASQVQKLSIEKTRILRKHTQEETIGYEEARRIRLLGEGTECLRDPSRKYQHCNMRAKRIVIPELFLS